MNIYQILVLIFGLFVAVLSIAGVVAVATSPHMRFKPLWIFGSLFGFVGLGIDWSTADDLILLFGVQVPVIMIFAVLGTGHVYVKTGLPIMAIVAMLNSLSKSTRSEQSEHEAD